MIVNAVAFTLLEPAWIGSNIRKIAQILINMNDSMPNISNILNCSGTEICSSSKLIESFKRFY